MSKVTVVYAETQEGTTEMKKIRKADIKAVKRLKRFFIVITPI